MTVASRAPGTLAGLRPTKLYDTYARLSFAAKRAASACRASVLLSASGTRSGPALVRGTPHRAWVALTRVPAFGCRSEKRQKVPSAVPASASARTCSASAPLLGPLARLRPYWGRRGTALVMLDVIECAVLFSD